MTRWCLHRSRAAIARIARARYASPGYVSAVALLRIDGGDVYTMIPVDAVAEACAEVADHEDWLADVSGEPA